MATGNLGAVLRLGALTLLAVALWAVTKYEYAMPTALGADAPVAVFSAARAEATLARILGPELPHPLSSEENAAVRTRILYEFAVLGVNAQSYRATGCNSGRDDAYIACATVTDIIAPIVPGTGKAIILLAHYDSVPAGPGASDDELGVASVLETVRALRARGSASRHPVIAVITDGEEFGLLGADAFLHNPALKAGVGAVVNVEARGTRGRSQLFQTSDGDAPLIDLYAASVRNYSTSSLYAEIYRLLPNDTDLTLFLRQGFTGFNFAFSDNVADYHTALDRRVNLSPATLQQQGDNLLGVATSLERTDFGRLKGKNAIYLDILGRFLPRLPASWALPLSLLSIVMLLGALFLSRGGAREGKDTLAAAAFPALLIAGAVGAGFVLHGIAQIVSGQPDPSYAYPTALGIALALGILGAALLVSRMTGTRRAALSVWFWYAGLSILTAILVPGLSPYFLFPVLAASLVLLLTARATGGWRGAGGDLALLLAALSALVIWLGMVATGPTLMGLKLHELFTLPGAFAAMTLVPLIAARRMTRRVWAVLSVIVFAGSAVAAVAAGLQPAFSDTAAQRLNIVYVEDRIAGRAFWAAETTAPLPPALKAVANFSKEARLSYPGERFFAYTAPARDDGEAAPGAVVSLRQQGGGTKRVTLSLSASPDAAQFLLFVPKAAMVRAVDLGGRHFAIPQAAARVVIACLSRDCVHASVTLTLAASGPFDITLTQFHYGAPSLAAPLLAARPKSAVPSQNGDGGAVIGKIHVPAS